MYFSNLILSLETKNYLFPSLQQTSACVCLLPLPAFLHGGQSSNLLRFAAAHHCQQCSRQTEQAQPSRERDTGGDTQRERQACSTAEQSTAAACPSPSATQEHRDACLLPPSQSHGVTLHSHTGFPLDDLHLLRRSVTRLEDSTVTHEASSVSPPLGMLSFLLFYSLLFTLPPPLQ